MTHIVFHAGYGDIHPVTNIGRWIISGAIIVASGVIPAQAAALVEALKSRQFIK